MSTLLTEYFKELQEEFACDLTPKEHFTSHYLKQIEQFGPLQNVWTLRLEAKHQYFLDVVKLNRCHKNVCMTLAKRHQFRQAVSSTQFLFSSNTTTSTSKCIPITKVRKELRGKVFSLCHDQNVNVCLSVKVKGNVYTPGNVIYTGNKDGLPRFEKVIQCYVISDKAYVGTCHMLTIDYEPHFNAYSVAETNDYSVTATKKLEPIATLGLYNLPVTYDSVVVLKHHHVFRGESH